MAHGRFGPYRTARRHVIRPRVGEQKGPTWACRVSRREAADWGSWGLLDATLATHDFRNLHKPREGRKINSAKNTPDSISPNHEWTEHETFDTNDAARLSVFECTEMFSHSERHRQTLDYESLTPFEAKHAPAQATETTQRLAKEKKSRDSPSPRPPPCHHSCSSLPMCGCKSV